MHHGYWYLVVGNIGWNILVFIGIISLIEYFAWLQFYKTTINKQLFWRGLTPSKVCRNISHFFFSIVDWITSPKLIIATTSTTTMTIAFLKFSMLCSLRYCFLCLTLPHSDTHQNSFFMFQLICLEPWTIIEWEITMTFKIPQYFFEMKNVVKLSKSIALP